VSSRGWNIASQAYPVFQDFENENACSPSATCTMNCILSSNWYNEQNGIFDDIDWRINSGPTPTTQTGPTVDANPGTSSGKYAYIESSDCFERTANLLSPCIDVPASGGELRFKLHAFGVGIMGSIHADLFDGERWHTNIVAPQSQNSGVYWQSRMADLSPFAGQTINIRFRAHTRNSERADFAVDDISISAPVSVNELSNSNIVIYPNPTYNELFFSKPMLGNFQITDARGRMVMTGSLNGQSINVAHLDDGIYIFHVNGIALRFVKMANH
jgi:hypothetical protein